MTHAQHFELRHGLHRIDRRLAGVTTGISAADRALTILTGDGSGHAGRAIWRGPGMFFRLRARDGGVLVRAGQTEAAVDLARLAGLAPGGVICEIMNEDGTMARVPQLLEFCARHGLKMVSVADLIRYRLQHERYIHRRGEGCCARNSGEFRMISYSSELERGDASGAGARRCGRNGRRAGAHAFALRRSGDVFGSTQCDCQRLVRDSLRQIARRGPRRAGVPASDRARDADAEDPRGAIA